MVDIKQALESDFITVEDIKLSPSKIIVIIGEGDYKQVSFNGEKSKRLVIPVSLDQKQKYWRPNRASLKATAAELGDNTKAWIGHKLTAQIIFFRGREGVLFSPEKAAQNAGLPPLRDAPYNALQYEDYDY